MVDKLKEDSTVALNNAGSGSVEGIGIGPKGEPGKKLKKLKDILIMKQPIKRN